MNETKQLEDYLWNRLTTEERLLMEARLMVNAALRDQLNWQQKTYRLIEEYGRKKLKSEIEQIQARMFSEERFKNFRKQIQTIFK
jgi:hypothetical protein